MFNSSSCCLLLLLQLRPATLPSWLCQKNKWKHRQTSSVLDVKGVFPSYMGEWKIMFSNNFKKLGVRSVFSSRLNQEDLPTILSSLWHNQCFTINEIRWEGGVGCWGYIHKFIRNHQKFRKLFVKGCCSWISDFKEVTSGWRSLFCWPKVTRSSAVDKWRCDSAQVSEQVGIGRTVFSLFRLMCCNQQEAARVPVQTGHITAVGSSHSVDSALNDPNEFVCSPPPLTADWFAEPAAVFNTSSSLWLWNTFKLCIFLRGFWDDPYYWCTFRSSIVFIWDFPGVITLEVGDWKRWETCFLNTSKLKGSAFFIFLNPSHRLGNIVGKKHLFIYFLLKGCREVPLSSLFAILEEVKRHSLWFDANCWGCVKLSCSIWVRLCDH